MAKLLLAQYGAFKLARVLELSAQSGAFAAVLYSFCPFILWESELSFELWQIPWIVMTFCLATKKLEAVRIVLLAAVCAFSVLTMHTECSFNAISVAVFFVLVRGALEKRFLISVRVIGAAAILSMALAAPILIAFSEFVLNSCCPIRADMTILPTVPINSILLCLWYPLFGPASSFLGFLSASLVLVPMWRPNRTELALLLSSFLALLLCTLPWPLSALFSVRPLNYLEPKYFFQILVLLLSLLAACGLERVSETSGKRLCAFAFAVFVTSAFCYYLLCFARLDVSGASWHCSMVPPVINQHVAARNFALSAVFACVCVILGIRDFKKLVRKNVCSYSLTLLTFASLWFVSRGSIPRTVKSFDYPVTECTEFLRKSNSRIVAVGRRFFSANVPALYGIRDLRLSTQLEPKGLNEFLAACRSTMSAETALPFQDTLSSFINLASVSFVVSRAPVVLDSELGKIATKSPVHSPNQLFHCGARLNQYAIVHDVRNRQVIGITRWLVPERDIQYYTVQAAVLSNTGQLLWKGQEMRLSEFHRVGAMQEIEVPYLLPLPRNCTSVSDLHIVVRLINRLTGAADWPASVDKRIGGPQVRLLLTPEPVASIVPNYSSLNLVLESKDGVRVYRNLDALPECYFVKEACESTSISDAVSRLRDNPELALKKVVLISSGRSAKVNNADSQQPSEVRYRALSLTRKSTVHLSVAVDAITDGWVVLTDTFYPGWHAYLDGKEVSIYRANVLFRAVSVPKGKHTLVFKYRPDSITIGVLLQFVAVLICITLLMRRPRQPLVD